jgi:hypothetical protein
MQEKDYSKGRNAVGGAAPETGRAAAVEKTRRKVSDEEPFQQIHGRPTFDRDGGLFCRYNRNSASMFRLPR